MIQDIKIEWHFRRVLYTVVNSSAFNSHIDKLYCILRYILNGIAMIPLGIIQRLIYKLRFGVY